MRQALHLLIVDPDRCAALVASCGSRWLLPTFTCGERVRVPPLAARWCADRSLPADVAGQWLGRVGADTIDWLVTIRAAPGPLASGAGLEWISLDALSSRKCVLDYQQWALGEALRGGHIPSVEGPFGNLGWPDAVRAWIAHVTGSPVGPVTPYRLSANEVVLGAQSARGPVYFKGLTAERTAEIQATVTLAALAPDSFAQTLALEHREHGSVWWLTAGCPGRPAGDSHAVAEALARIQQQVMSSGGNQLALRELDLQSAARWAAGLLGDSPCAAVIQRHCQEAMRADVPYAWIPMDLDPANVLVDDEGRVRFIDVDDSFFGPAPLALAAFGRAGRDAALYRTYERSWSPPLAAIEWRDFEIAGSVVQVWLGWERLLRNVQRGEVHAALDLVTERVRERLRRTIYRR